MSGYAFSMGPYFFGALLIAFMLAIVSIWWNRSPILKATALLALAAFVLVVFSALSKEDALIRQVVNDFRVMMNDLLSRPRPVTFKVLQDMLPEGHAGHLVLYGEIKAKDGVYLLLRSPHNIEPRYYMLEADKKLQEQFKTAKREAKEKNTQLLLGGKSKGSRGGDRLGSGLGAKGKGQGADDFGEEGAMNVFHPAPVSDGPEKNSRPQDQPIHIGVPGSEHQ